jgi:peptide/nickel transport system substrate-binding protein
MEQLVSWQLSSKANKWQGRNIPRWQNKEYDDIFTQATKELDPVKRAAMFIKLNDIAVGDGYVKPIVYRPKVTALKNGLTAHLSGWDNDLYQLASWYKDA